MVKLWSFTSATLGCRCFPHIIMVSALISLAAISLSTHFSVYLCIDLSSSWDCTMPCNTHVFCIFESHFPSFENAFHTAWPNSFFFFQNMEFLGAVKLFLSSKRVILSARALAPLWREIHYFVNCMPFSPLMLLEKLLFFFYQFAFNNKKQYLNSVPFASPLIQLKSAGEGRAHAERILL